MKRLEADYLRLNKVMLEECPSGIEPGDIHKATTLGESIGAKPTRKQEKEWGIDPTGPIKRLSKALLAHTESLKELKTFRDVAPARKGGAVPESTINFLAWEMLVRCNNDKRVPPTELLDLLRIQLSIRPLEQSRRDEELSWKLEESSLCAYRNPEMSFRAIANRFEIDVSTVTRWNEKYDLRKRGERLHGMLAQIDKNVAKFHADIAREAAKIDDDEAELQAEIARELAALRK